MATATRRKPTREELQPGEVLCQHCTAKCCRYFALPIEAPESHRDFEFLRWYLLHDRASVFTEDGSWYLMVHTVCRHLQADNRCGAYETRPTICREYTTDACEYEDDWTYEHYFETPEQVAEFMDATLPKKRGETIRSPQPSLLPIL